VADIGGLVQHDLPHWEVIAQRKIPEWPAPVNASFPLSKFRKRGAQAETEERLLELSRRGSDDLLMSRAERLAAAYRDRARKIAYVAADQING
jgi:hypothetical protein